MTELLSNLDEPPKKVDRIATLRKVIREPTIRLELDRSEPKTLEEAYAAAVNAATAVRSARASATTTNAKSNNPPRPQSSQQPGPTQHTALSTICSSLSTAQPSAFTYLHLHLHPQFPRP